MAILSWTPSAWVFTAFDVLTAWSMKAAGVVEELEDVPAEGAEAVGVEAEHLGIMS